MTEQGNGGAAFPPSRNGAGAVLGGQQGMSLRDYFAAAALQGALAAMDSGERNYANPDVIALTAYLIADAMLQERAKC